jgi:hypothetical protein
LTFCSSTWRRLCGRCEKPSARNVAFTACVSPLLCNACSSAIAFGVLRSSASASRTDGASIASLPEANAGSLVSDSSVLKLSATPFTVQSIGWR